MTQLYAQPYDTSKTGFYFDSDEEFEEKILDSGCEEYEIQFIDGDAHLPALFKAAEIDQSSLVTWFDDLDPLSEEDSVKVLYLLGNYDLAHALDNYEEVCIFIGTRAEYAQEVTEDCSEIPEYLAHYIAWDSLGYDMELEGSICEISDNVWVTNASQL